MPVALAERDLDERETATYATSPPTAAPQPAESSSEAVKLVCKRIVAVGDREGDQSVGVVGKGCGEVEGGAVSPGSLARDAPAIPAVAADDPDVRWIGVTTEQPSPAPAVIKASKALRAHVSKFQSTSDHHADTLPTSVSVALALVESSYVVC